jgi:hypothetical protein
MQFDMLNMQINMQNNSSLVHILHILHIAICKICRICQIICQNMQLVCSQRLRGPDRPRWQRLRLRPQHIFDKDSARPRAGAPSRACPRQTNGFIENSIEAGILLCGNGILHAMLVARAVTPWQRSGTNHSESYSLPF